MPDDSFDVYENLAAHLDDLPGGYPRTPSGVELRILRRLFTPEEAGLALHLTLLPEEARVVALRAGQQTAAVGARLEAMERKGLIFATRTGTRVRYGALQFVVGIWEAQVNRLTPGLVADFDEYLPHLFDHDTWRKMPQMRVVPVNRSIAVRAEVMPYELAEELVREGRGKLSVANCICRQEKRLAGRGCDKPLETCLGMGTAAEMITRSGRGRPINEAEALDILKAADEAGLVLQPGNSREAVFICTCCGCCCGILRSLKRREAPADYVSSPFVAALDADTCSGCGTCVDRCQMQALSLAGGRASLDASRCIGCGLCVTTCPTGSLTLARKPESAQPRVPATLVQNYLKLAQARGRMKLPSLVGMQVRSTVDRLRAR